MTLVEEASRDFQVPSMQDEVSQSDHDVGQSISPRHGEVAIGHPSTQQLSVPIPVVNQSASNNLASSNPLKRGISKVSDADQQIQTAPEQKKVKKTSERPSEGVDSSSTRQEPVVVGGVCHMIETVAFVNAATGIRTRAVYHHKIRSLLQFEASQSDPSPIEPRDAGSDADDITANHAFSHAWRADPQFWETITHDVLNRPARGTFVDDFANIMAINWIWHGKLGMFDVAWYLLQS